MASQLVQINRGPACKSYHPSQFNARTKDSDGHLILYNAFTGNSCVIPPRSAPDALRYLAREGTPGPLDGMGRYLERKGYIVESTVDEGARFALRYGLLQFRTDVLELILLASEDCNFRCVYCSQEFKRGGMLPQVRAGVRALISDRAPGFRALHISWFGGEPLLGYEGIEEIAPFAQETARRLGIQYVSGITTNGYLLTPERFEALVGWGVRSYQITVDGGPLEHDSHRPLQRGGGTFQRIADNLSAMAAHPGEFEVAVRVNFDRTNSGRLAPLFEALQSRLGGDRRFKMRFQPVDKWGGPNDDALDVCGSREAIERWRDLAGQSAEFGIAVEPLADSLNPQGGVCYAARPYSFVIGADGKVMKCTVALDTLPANIVGRLEADGRLLLDQDAFAAWVRPVHETDAMCQRCFFVPVCQGMSCPLPRVASGKRVPAGQAARRAGVEERSLAQAEHRHRPSARRPRYRGVLMAGGRPLPSRRF